MYTISTNEPLKNIIKHIRYRLNENYFLRWIRRQRQRQTPGAFLSCEREMSHLLKGVYFAILVYRCDVVTPFGRKDKRGRRCFLLRHDLTGC